MKIKAADKFDDYDKLKPVPSVDEVRAILTGIGEGVNVEEAEPTDDGAPKGITIDTFTISPAWVQITGVMSRAIVPGLDYRDVPGFIVWTTMTSGGTRDCPPDVDVVEVAACLSFPQAVGCVLHQLAQARINAVVEALSLQGE